MNNNTLPLTSKMGDSAPDLNRVVKEREFENVKPNFLRKLHEKVQNLEEVGRMIGMSGSSVGTALQFGKCRLVTELAAEHVYMTNFAPKPTAVTDPVQYVIVAAPASRLKSLESFLDKEVFRVTPLPMIE